MTWQVVTYRKGRVYRSESEKQRLARERNWYIRKLRAYFHLCPLFGPEHEKARKKIERIIDREIIRVGGESEIKRVKKKYKEWEKKLALNSQLATQDFDFPEFKTGH